MTEKVSIPLEEQETIIAHSPNDEWCEIYTTEFYIIRYLEKMAKDYPDHYQLIAEDKYSVTYRVMFKLVKPRKPIIVSEEQRKLRAERLKARRPVLDKE